MPASDRAETGSATPRACIRVMKVARTLADLEGELHIGTVHVAEAISYRGSASRAKAPG